MLVRCRNRDCGAKIRVPDGKDLSDSHCPKCRELLMDDEDFASDLLGDVKPSKSTTFESSIEEPERKIAIPATLAKEPKPEQKYWALKMLADVNARITIAVAILATLGIMASFVLGISESIPVNESLLIGGASLAVLCFDVIMGLAYSQVIYLFLDCESHLRKIADRD